MPYESCGSFLAELANAGVAHVVVSPGSRSTPLAVSAAAQPDLTLHVNLDERAAGFFALGLAKASRAPVALICTSGTAAANYLPAVVEAHYSGVPLIVLTADRPPELRGQGAGQTIDQIHLYGSHVRRFVEMPIAGDVGPAVFRREAIRSVAAATGPASGPVHCNWPLREPLEPAARVISPAAELAPIQVGPQVPTTESIDTLVRLIELYERGVIVAGPLDIDDDLAEAIGALAQRVGWPILADPASQLRTGRHGPIVSTADHLLRHDFGTTHGPDVVIRVGATPTSKPLRLWLERVRPGHTVLVTEPGRFDEPAFVADYILEADLGAVVQAVRRRLDARDRTSGWLDAWMLADTAATGAIDATFEDLGTLSEAQTARVVSSSVQADSALYVSNSMPVRDLDGFMARRSDSVRVFVNRGANGIDGLIASARGVAASGTPVTLLLGDIAALHDIGSLLAAARSGDNITVVIVDNDGGGIFNFLPIAGVFASDQFELLFGTPHGTDFAFLGGVAGLRYRPVVDTGDLEAAVRDAGGSSGLDVVHVKVARSANVGVRDRVNRAVAESLA